MWASEELRFLEQVKAATKQSLQGVFGARELADEARLVYCDYLDEMADDRGEYLRNELAFAHSLGDPDQMKEIAQLLSQSGVRVHRRQQSTLDFIVLKRWLDQVSIPFHVVIMTYGSYRNHVVDVALRYCKTDWFGVQQELSGARQPIIIRDAVWSDAWKAVNQINHPVKELGEGLSLVDAPHARIIRADCKLTN